MQYKWELENTEYFPESCYVSCSCSQTSAQSNPKYLPIVHELMLAIVSPTNGTLTVIGMVNCSLRSLGGPSSVVPNTLTQPRLLGRYYSRYGSKEQATVVLKRSGRSEPVSYTRNDDLKSGSVDDLIKVFRFSLIYTII